MWLVNILSFLTRFYVRHNAGTNHFVEEYAHETGFAEHYKKLIQPYVQEYENKRIKALDGARIRFFICMILAPYMVLIPTVLLLTHSSLEYEHLATQLLFGSLAVMSIYVIVYAITCRLFVTVKKENKNAVVLSSYHPFIIF